MNEDYKNGYRDGFCDGWIQRQMPTVPGPYNPTSMAAWKCGTCGMIFELGKPYGYVCGNSKCPTAVRATSSTGGGEPYV